jgi:hypothetical protein
VFVTSIETKAVATDYEFYNNFINNDVLSPLEFEPLDGIVGKSTFGDVEWKAMVSTTEAPDTHDNIGYSSSFIYTLLGDMGWEHGDEMFDTTWATPLNVDEMGEIHDGSAVWTGGNFDGLIRGNPLGMVWSTVGIIGDPSDWLHSALAYRENEFSIYASSEELTVVPAPTAVILGILGLGTAGIKLRKRKEI